MPFRDIFTHMKKAGSEEPAKSGMKDLVFLECDVAVCAVDDAAGWKTPIIVCHASDGSLVLAGEGYTCQTTAAVKRPPLDARHAVRYRHACQAGAAGERVLPDARHAVRNRHRRQPTAIVKRLVPDARHAVRNRHRRQSSAVLERPIPDARRIGSDFDCLRAFYPIIGISIKQPSVDHRLPGYLARPVVFLDASVYKRYLRLWVSGWF